MLVCWKVRCYDSGMVSTEIRMDDRTDKIVQAKKNCPTWSQNMAEFYGKVK